MTGASTMAHHADLHERIAALEARVKELEDLGLVPRAILEAARRALAKEE